MKLNLGCGDDVKDDYVNVDFRKTRESVLQADLSKFPWPFKDNSADEILMLDFLEHFPYAKTLSILLECFRILKDDGARLVIQVPDGDHLARALGMVGEYLCNRCGGEMGTSWVTPPGECSGCGQSVYDIADAAMKRLYGGQDYEGNYHYTVFTKNSLKLKAFTAGLIFVEDEEISQQYPNWNFKVSFQKGNLWNA